MNIIYWQSGIKNFGDELNRDFYHRALGLDLIDYKSAEAVLGIGSILDYDTTSYKAINVLGSGSGFDKLNLNNIDDYRFWFVRGPNTAKVLGLESDLAISDPAILVPDLYQYSFKNLRKSGTLFIPHYFSALNGDWSYACNIAGVNYRDPTSSLFDICRDIASSELVITESLHGAILADTYRVPWILVATPPIARSPFKWHDWTASINKKYNPICLPWLWTKQINFSEKVSNFTKYHLAKLGCGPSRWENKRFEVHGEREILECGNLLKKVACEYEGTLSQHSLLMDLQERMLGKLDDFKKYVIN